MRVGLLGAWVHSFPVVLDIGLLNYWMQEVCPCGPGVTELEEGGKDAIEIAFLESYL